MGTVSDADWRRLRDQALAAQPRCPDCGSAWDLEAAIEEEHVVAGEGHLISLCAPCSRFDADEAAPVTNRAGTHGPMDSCVTNSTSPSSESAGPSRDPASATWARGHACCNRRDSLALAMTSICSRR